MDGLLIHRVAISRVSVVYDSQGAPVETWNSITTGVPCMIQRARSPMAYQNRGQVYIPTHEGFFRTGVNIAVGDKIEDGTNKYLVRAVDSRQPASNQVEVSLELLEGWR